MTNTTNTNASTEHVEKMQDTLSVADLEMRDYFAAQAMQSLISKAPFGELPAGETHPIYAAVALGAYDYADAMLAVRAGAQP